MELEYKRDYISYFYIMKKNRGSLPNTFGENNNNYSSTGRIVVLGVGGAGCNAVEEMVKSEITGIEFAILNTDNQVLVKSEMPEHFPRIQLGPEKTAGLGAGADPNVGRLAAEESLEEIQSIVNGAVMVIIMSGMGGGTGTGASPVIAEMLHSMNILTIAIVTLPFAFESKRRMEVAEIGLANLEKWATVTIVAPNQNVFRIANEKTDFREACRMADKILEHILRAITSLITDAGMINVDLADMKTMMSYGGRGTVGIGIATGENRGQQGAESAILNPLIKDSSLEGAKGVLISIAAESMTLFEVEEAVERVRKVASKAEIMFGAVYREGMGDKFSVTVIATGLPQEIKTSEILAKDDWNRLDNKNMPRQKIEIRTNIDCDYSSEKNIDNIDNIDNKTADKQDRIFLPILQYSDLFKMRNKDDENNRKLEDERKRDENYTKEIESIDEINEKKEGDSNRSNLTRYYNIDNTGDEVHEKDGNSKSALYDTVAEKAASDDDVKRRDFFDIPAFLRRNRDK